MQSLSVKYDDIERAIDDVRQLLDEWLEASDEAPMSAWQTHTLDGSPPSGGSPPSSAQGNALNRDAPDRDAPDRDTPNQDAQNQGAPSQDAPSQDAPSTETGHASGNETAGRQIPPDVSGSRTPTDPNGDASGAAPSINGSDEPARTDADTRRNGRPSIVRYLQVVLHEWLANLIQHARFEETNPHIEITIRMQRRYISCSVVDNSTGFNLSEQLEIQRNQAQALPERGMGLRIISACTGRCEYRSSDDGRHHFEFSIPVDHEPWLSTLF